MKTLLLFLSITILYTSSVNCYDPTDCLAIYGDDTAGTTTPSLLTNNSQEAYTTAYKIKLTGSGGVCHHEALSDFYVWYDLGTSDTDSMFLLTYYFMTFDNSYACVVSDESGTASTLKTFMNYNTAYDGGADIDPCGYDIFLEYDGTNTYGYFYYLTNDNAKVI